MICDSEKNSADRKACLLIPARRGGEANAELSVRHLHELGVSSWVHVAVVSSDENHASFPESHATHLEVENPQPTWGALFSHGVSYAKKQGAEIILWLEPGTLPRVNVLKRLVEISRCRTALAGPGRVQFSCESSRSGGFKKTIAGLKNKTVRRGEIIFCDAVSEHCGCLPTSVLPTLDLSDDTNFWSAIDLGLTLTKNGTPCLVDGESAVDYVRSAKVERESWLLTERPILEIWKRAFEADCDLNFSERVRFFSRHWGPFGIFFAVHPFLKLTGISVIRGIFPIRLLRRFYGSRSLAWQLQQLSTAKR